MSNKIGLLEVKAALKDPNFQAKLPQDFQPKIKKFLSNPGCSCNIPIYKEVLLQFPDILKQYYPNRELKDIKKETENLAKNNFSVINCNVRELESLLKKLGPGRKQIAIARYEDQVTVIVNELDIIHAI